MSTSMDYVRKKIILTAWLKKKKIMEAFTETPGVAGIDSFTCG